ncbi:MAG: hypothetical protein RLO81_07135 [Fulvivirga sp.]|uniref:hypothetical protein n=1 Tax=Fulvivirga sp. TaxID=1931237 RepID=UPI0032EB21FD
MKVALVPTYSHIFDGPSIPITKLLDGISKELLLNTVTVINAELFSTNDHPTSQINILKFLLRRQNAELKISIFEKIADFYLNHNRKDFAIFSPHITLEFLHHVLIEMPNINSLDDTTPLQELNFFKAYLIYSEGIIDRTIITTSPVDPLDFFQRNIWPIFISQLEINHYSNFLTSIIKAKCLFDFLQHQSPFNEFVERFIKTNEVENTWSYFVVLINALNNGINSNKTELGLNPFYIKVDNEINLFEDLCFDHTSYSEHFKLGKDNYKGFKEKPLVKYAPKTYLVIHWNLLAGKLYGSLIFDFFKKTGIYNHPRFKNEKNPFLSFKQYIGSNFIENYIFRKVISSIFKKRHAIVRFDDSNNDGFPDAYVRVGNRIFLFEIKDALFPSKGIESNDYSIIKNKIDEKYNSKRKGISQLIKQIRNLESNSFEDKSFNDLNIKKRNLIIYPIIIYTDIYFSMPGVSLYLQNEFKKRVKIESFAQFKNIKSLSFFNLDFLIENLDLLTIKRFELDKIIDYVSKQVIIRGKKYYKNRIPNDLHLWNDNFEAIASNKLTSDQLSRDYVNYVFKELELK